MKSLQKDIWYFLDIKILDKVQPKINGEAWLKVYDKVEVDTSYIIWGSIRNNIKRQLK